MESVSAPATSPTNREGLSQPWRASLETLVSELKRTGAIRTEVVERAFVSTPRHLFIRDYWFVDTQARGLVAEHGRDHHDPSAADLERIYADSVLVTLMKRGQPLSSSTLPSLAADILETLELRPGLRVLEVGGGVGYTAALIASIVGPENVTTIELLPELHKAAEEALSEIGAEQVQYLSGDGWQTDKVGEVDRVLVSVACADIAPHWHDHLNRDGMLCVPLQVCSGATPIVSLQQHGEQRFRGRVATWATFMEARGQGSVPPKLRRYFSAPAGSEIDPSTLRAEDLWPGFSDVDNHLSFRSGARKLGFCLYAALVDPLAIATSRGFGLYDDHSRDFSLVAHDRLLSRGAVELRQRLGQRYGEWMELGAPELHDYWIEAAPNGSAGPSDVVGEIRRPRFTYRFGL